MSTDAVTYAFSSPIQDAELEQLHAAAFGGVPSRTPWSANLQRYSLFWVTAHHDGHLVGFVNVLGDGGAHAILMDTCVSPHSQNLGIGVELVARAAHEARRRGCHWLHADYEPALTGFYEGRCGLRPTSGGADAAAVTYAHAAVGRGLSVAVVAGCQMSRTWTAGASMP